MSRRLLFVVNEAWYFLSHRLALAQAAAAAGWEVHVVTAPAPEQAQIRAAGFATHSVPLSRSGLRADRELKSVLALARVYREVRPELVHLVALKAIVLGGMAARLRPVPALVMTFAGLGHIFTEEGIAGAVGRSMFRLVLRSIVSSRTRLIVQNPDDLKRLAPRRAMRRRAVLIPGSGVDLARFRSVPEPIPPVTVLMPSRMIWKKGVGDFVAAARALKAEGLAARFCLAGNPDPGNPQAVPSAQLQDWHDEGVIEWLGHRDDMPALLRASHLVCLPSFYGEGIPKSLIEAAAAGRPAVTTDIPGCRDIVRHGESGLLVQPRNVPALADALRRLIEDRELRRKFGARARAIAEPEFGQEQIIAATLAVYREVTG